MLPYWSCFDGCQVGWSPSTRNMTDFLTPLVEVCLMLISSLVSPRRFVVGCQYHVLTIDSLLVSGIGGPIILLSLRPLKP
jgi:hypothetical protein